MLVCKDALDWPTLSTSVIGFHGCGTRGQMGPVLVSSAPPAGDKRMVERFENLGRKQKGS